MTLEEFISNYNGKTVGTGQCVALIKQYESDVLGITPQSVGNAHEYYDNYDNSSFLKENYTKISKSQELPQIGDIVVWSTAVGGGNGHIAIIYKDITSSKFTSFDQNWNTPLKCKIESHSYSNVLGYLRAKTSPGPTPPGPEPTPSTYKKKKFKWALYANKLRNKRKE